MYNMKNKFIKVFKEIYQHDKFRELDGDYIIYYSWLLDLNELSKKNAKDFTDRNGRLYVIFTELDAYKYCNIKKGKLYRIKKKLKELGLIDYEEQRVKKAGISTPIYVTPYEHWSIFNEGLTFDCNEKKEIIRIEGNKLAHDDSPKKLDIIYPNQDESKMYAHFSKESENNKVLNEKIKQYQEIAY